MKEKQEAKVIREQLKEYAEDQLEGRQHGYSLYPVKELVWLVLDMSPSVTFSNRLDMWHSAV